MGYKRHIMISDVSHLEKRGLGSWLACGNNFAYDLDIWHFHKMLNPHLGYELMSKGIVYVHLGYELINKVISCARMPF